MPHFRLETNVPKEKIPTTWLAELLPIIANTLGKPINVTCVQVVPDQLMACGEPGFPCAQATLMSIGKLSPEECKKHTKVISDKVTKDLNIAPERFFIRYIDAKPEHIGKST